MNISSAVSLKFYVKSSILHKEAAAAAFCTRHEPWKLALSHPILLADMYPPDVGCHNPQKKIGKYNPL